MAANYWESSQFQRFLLTRLELGEIESHQLEIGKMTQHEITHMKIYFANLLQKIGKRLRVRQEIIATAIVYFKRFYINNLLNDIDPYLMSATCMYLACKAGEFPHHIKFVCNESKAAFAEISSSIKFPYNVADIAECESYLLEEMKFYLVIYHPYQVLIDISEQIKLPKPSLQAAWSMINDSYRTDVTFIYPPHVIAIAALFLSRVVDQGNQTEAEAQQWFSELNVDMTDVLQIVDDLLVLYESWKVYNEKNIPDLVARYIQNLSRN